MHVPANRKREQGWTQGQLTHTNRNIPGRIISLDGNIGEAISAGVPTVSVEGGAATYLLEWDRSDRGLMALAYRVVQSRQGRTKTDASTTT